MDRLASASPGLVIKIDDTGSNDTPIMRWSAPRCSSPRNSALSGLSTYSMRWDTLQKLSLSSIAFAESPNGNLRPYFIGHA